VSCTGKLLLNIKTTPLTRTRGESGIGTWKLIIRDTDVNEHSGNFTDFHLKLWGEAIDASKAVLLPMPSETDDDDHSLPSIPTTTASVATTSVSPIPTVTPTSEAPLPSDHPDRPVNAKPSATAETGNTDLHDPVKPSSPPDTTTPSPSPSASAVPSSWLPGWLPSFGFGPKTTIWMYGAVVLIVAFCSGLGVYFYIARRKRLANRARDNYEFDLIRDDEETEGLTGGVAARGGRRRAGELYDAFAAGSDEEDGPFSLDEEEEGEYRDAERGEGAGLMDTEHHVIGGDSESEEENIDEKGGGGGER